MGMKRLIAILCTLALTVPGVAMAQSSDEGYGGSGGIAGQVEENGGTSKVGNTDQGTLPFSGVELFVPLLVGGVLMLVGLGLHRRSYHRPA